MIEIKQNNQVKTCVICPLLINEHASACAESRLLEACRLAQAINLEIRYKEIAHIRLIKPATYFNRGVIDKLKSTIETNEIELMVVDGRLSPIQQRNLERELKIKVIDRTALILEIFGQRAQTKEGSLQVELAHLTYQRSRLVRSWTHLERQRGGAGFLGGPGETQIELDRRLIDDRIVRIKKDLEKVKKTRDIQRSARRKFSYPIVALVGYTNAGKSTLFNYLTDSDVMTADMLFATLDPTMRKMVLPNGMEIILSDTVGFIADLPHELIMAFRATLEEVLNADLVLHVCDISNSDYDIQKNDVIKVLESLGLKEIEHSSDYIEVLNKSDLLDKNELEKWTNKVIKSNFKVLISALTGQGKDKLLSLIVNKLSSAYKRCTVNFKREEGKLKSWLYENSEVIKLENNKNGYTYNIRISAVNLSRLINMAANNEFVSIKENV